MEKSKFVDIQAKLQDIVSMISNEDYHDSFLFAHVNDVVECLADLIDDFLNDFPL